MSNPPDRSRDRQAVTWRSPWSGPRYPNDQTGANPNHTKYQSSEMQTKTARDLKQKANAGDPNAGSKLTTSA
jgi:hypothetical protein